MPDGVGWIILPLLMAVKISKFFSEKIFYFDFNPLTIKNYNFLTYVQASFS